MDTNAAVQSEVPKYVIEKNIPMPARKGGPVKKKREDMYPFRKMKMGDSFVFPKSHTVRVTVACTYWGKKLGMHFSVRRISDTELRCWRVRKNAKNGA